jgi:hypothetical protein
MKIQARGWHRDHGAHEVASGDVTKASFDGDAGMYRGDTYIDIVHPLRYQQLKVRISMSNGVAEKIALNGDYQFIIEILKNEIGTLFYLTHANDDLYEIIANLAKHRTQSN